VSPQEAGRPPARAGVRRRFHRITRTAAVAGSCVALASGLAGCAGGASATPTRATVRSSAIPGLGRVLVDGGGYTLYIYVPDHGGPSRCFGLCAKQWPPLLLARGQRRAAAGPGVRPGLLGVDTRPGGARQVTYHGWPLYTYVDDTSPGKVTGQAEDMGAWYTMSVTGAVDHDLVATAGD
jgi:predicted lipoprotein with Yx(FWY)xxD motif